MAKRRGRRALHLQAPVGWGSHTWARHAWAWLVLAAASAADPASTVTEAPGCPANRGCGTFGIVDQGGCSSACDGLDGSDGVFAAGLNESTACYCCGATNLTCCKHDWVYSPQYFNLECDVKEPQGAGAVVLLVLGILALIGIWSAVPFMWYKKLLCFDDTNKKGPTYYAINADGTDIDGNGNGNAGADGGGGGYTGLQSM